VKCIARLKRSANKGLVTFAVGALVAAGIVAAPSPSLAAGDPCSGVIATGTCDVPAGVTSMLIVATGGGGAGADDEPGGTVNGGSGAVVSSVQNVVPGATLDVTVGTRRSIQQ